MDYKMVFLDLDNTLLSSDLSISDENLNAIRRASKNGVKIVICTGRGVFAVKNILEQLEIDLENCYTICLNGGAFYKGYPPELVKENVFDSHNAAIVYEMAYKYGVDIQIYRDNTLMVEKINERIQKYIDRHTANYIVIDSILNYDGKISKILLNGSHDTLVKVQKDISKKIDGKLNCFFTSDEYLEFTGIGITKGEAMIELANSLGIDIKETIAVGDSFNDMSMIKTAGLGVAVRNAVDELKKEANYITKNTNDESAVAEVINRYIFGENKVTVGEYKFRIPVNIFIIILIIEQALAHAFNWTFFKIIKYEYIYGIGDTRKIGIGGVLIPLVLCFIVDYVNQRTKKEDEEEFWADKYGRK